MSKLIDILGLRYGQLVVVSRSDRISKAGALWVCRCDCGGETVTTGTKLKSGHTRSCGCQQKKAIQALSTTHGMSNKTRTYKTWKEMRRRCMNKNSTQYQWYGGRGISVCDRWNSYEAFLEDMGERPIGTTIDRINSDGNYEPGNCRWATSKQQAETNSGVFKRGIIPHNKISEDGIRLMVEMRKAGKKLREIADLQNINQATVCTLTVKRMQGVART